MPNSASRPRTKTGIPVAASLERGAGAGLSSSSPPTPASSSLGRTGEAVSLAVSDGLGDPYGSLLVSLGLALSLGDGL
jgi:hypothetical protein